MRKTSFFLSKHKTEKNKYEESGFQKSCFFKKNIYADEKEAVI